MRWTLRIGVSLLTIGALLAGSVNVLASAAASPAASHAAKAKSKKKPAARCKTTRKTKRGAKKCLTAKKPTAKKPGAKSPGGTTPAGTTPQPTPGATTTPQASPTERFNAMFKNSGWDRQYTVNTSPPEGRESLYNFCSGGQYFYRFTNQTTSSEYRYTGTWQLLDVKTGVVAGYNVVEGRVSETSTDQYGSPDSATIVVDLSEQVPNSAYIDGNEYTRVTPGAC